MQRPCISLASNTYITFATAVSGHVACVYWVKKLLILLVPNYNLKRPHLPCCCFVPCRYGTPFEASTVWDQTYQASAGKLASSVRASVGGSSWPGKALKLSSPR